MSCHSSRQYRKGFTPSLPNSDILCLTRTPSLQKRLSKRGLKTREREKEKKKTCLIVLENNSVNIDVVFFLLKEYKRIVERESDFRKVFTTADSVLDVRTHD